MKRHCETGGYCAVASSAGNVDEDLRSNGTANTNVYALIRFFYIFIWVDS